MVNIIRVVQYWLYLKKKNMCSIVFVHDFGSYGLKTDIISVLQQVQRPKLKFK